jgi:hypothetical protein
MYGELLNVIASFGYWGTSLWGLIVLFPWAVEAPFQAGTALGQQAYYADLYNNNQAGRVVLHRVTLAWRLCLFDEASCRATDAVCVCVCVRACVSHWR